MPHVPISILSQESVEPAPEAAKALAKPRDDVFDVAKGLGILLVFGIHCSNNSSRLYTDSRSAGWWSLTLLNRFCNFAVPLFLLLSAVLYARSYAAKPDFGKFYKRRFTGVLWPYLVWSLLYFGFRMFKEPSARKLIPGNLFGFKCTGPALLMHPKERLLELVWGKASFHLYFLVVLLGIIAFLPPTVAYLKWRKAGFIEAIVASCVIQGGIFILQHNYLKLQFPASTILWYVGSLVPGACIGMHWDEFREKPNRFAIPLTALSLLSGYIFFKGEIGVFLGIPEENYPTLGSQAMYTSCMAILALSLCLSLTVVPAAVKLLKPIGTHSLQLYLIHPIFITVLERPAITHVLNATYLGAILSPLLMFALTVATIGIIRVVRLEKPLFGR